MSDVLLRLSKVDLSYPLPRRTWAERLGLVSTGTAPALRSVDLAVHVGEALGIVGDNGAGKTTLLRVAAGVLGVDAGAVEAVPGVRALLELGAGFDPSRTGWENARFLAAMTGVRREVLEASRDEIEELAGASLDVPTRTYSQGMLLRLAFAVSILDAPRVLLVDEAFLVGDRGFRARARERIHALRAAGTALVIAGHDHELLREECDRVVWLDRGEVRADGEVEAVLDRYHAFTSGAGGPVGDATGPGLVAVRRRGGARALRPGDPLELDLHLSAGRGERVAVGARLFDEFGHQLWGGRDPGEVAVGPSGAVVEVALSRLPLAPGRYRLEVGVLDLASGECRRTPDAFVFQVLGEVTGRGRLALDVRWTARAAGAAA